MKKYLSLFCLLILSVSCKEIILEDFNLSKNKVLPHLDPNQEWILVPENAGGMGLPAFYVMKYEAKAMLNDESVVDADGLDGAVTNWGLTTHKPASLADNQPWRYINANNAAAECESLGSGYHLISNPEWMAIARDIETQDVNWTAGTEGSGCLFRGNSGETTTGDGTNIADSCGYDGADPEEGSFRDLRAKHVLSNTQEIYDFSGNLWEWTDWDMGTVGFQIGPTTCTSSWAELAVVICPALVDSDYQTLDGSYSSTQGVGFFTGGSSGAALRGASWDAIAGAGAFTLYMNHSSAFAAPNFGFRCVYRP